MGCCHRIESLDSGQLADDDMSVGNSRGFEHSHAVQSFKTSLKIPTI